MTETQYSRTPPAVYGAVRRVFQWAERLLFRSEVTGLEHVPRDGAFLAVVNHLSIADPALIYAYFPRQMMAFVADKWRRVFGLRQLVEAVGVIWVARGEADLSAIKQALAALRAGQPLGLAPEGTRSPQRALQAGKVGAAYLADRAGVPILPVAIVGTERLAENVRHLRRTPARLIVGAPFRLPPDGRASAARLAEHTEQIMCRIAALLPPEYRGVYADHPGLRRLLEGGR